MAALEARTRAGSIVAPRMRRMVHVFLLVSLAAAVLSGCGMTAREKRDIARAERITKEYALASGPRACGLLTNHAVKALYGNWTRPWRFPRSIRRRPPSECRGEPVTIARTELLDENTIKVNAL